MISTFFIAIGGFVFTALATVLPASEGLPSGIQSALELVASSLNAIGYILPISALFTALGIIVSYEAAIWIYHGILWVWKKIPIIGR